MFQDMNEPESSALDEKSSSNEPETSKKGKAPTPLPWSQLFIVYLIQFSEPVTATVIYPFINQFVRDTGITGGDERKTGYFAGIIESAFFFMEAATVIAWGAASDRFGRRPVLLWGPFGLSLVMLAFGMSSTFWLLVMLRCLQGVFNGNIGVAKAVIGELTDSTNIADAFSVLPFMWSTGEIVGPTIGGLLSRPAERWPHTIGQLEYLRKRPYFLPCLAASTVAFQSFLGGLIILKETLPLPKHETKRRMKPETPLPTPGLITTLVADRDPFDSYSNETSHRRFSWTDCESDPFQISSEDLPSRQPTLRELISPDVAIVLLNSGLFTFCGTAATVLIPLVWSTSAEHGGLGFTPYKIGMTLGAYGIFNAFVQLRFLGKMLKRFGPQKVFVASALSLLLHFSCFVIARSFARQAGGADWRVWCTIVVQLLAEMMSYAAYGSMQVMVQGVSPSKSALGTMNGMAQAISSVARSFAPFFASSLHAISLQRNLVGGNAVYCIMFVIVACCIPFTFLLPQKLRLD